MNIKEYAEANNLTLQQAFTEAFRSVFGKPPIQSRIELDVATYNAGRITTHYVESYLNYLRRQRNESRH